jgi:aminopeptidase N
MLNKFLFFFLVSLTIVSCGDVDSNDIVANSVDTLKNEIVDAHSYSNFNDVNTKHLHLDLSVDFETKTLSGFVKHTIDNSNNSEKIIFDIKGVEVEKVYLNDNDESIDFKVVKGSETGDALEVPIDSKTKEVTIFYNTTSKSEALQWLNPQQTAGKNSPYLFTQGQAILTRTWIPCQDTPANRITYSAHIHCDSSLMTLMSADNPTEKSFDGNYSFEMNNPIPCYLIALAVGDLEFQPLGERTGVYTESVMMEKSVDEFTEVESMVEAAEELYGEYKWGRYDIIVLPPSFPFGGMENPKLTFATPTIIAGDKSLVSLIAHELAHSWSGNLVTNATWNDFWLNEGFTVYFENRIMEKIYGKERSDMLLMIEYQELVHENEDMLGGDHPEDTKLKLALDDRNPDDGMTTIAYVKGALFLKTMEEAVGREKFDVFLNKYFDEHAFQTITTEEFIEYTTINLLKENDFEFNMNEWIFEEGIPNNCVKIESDKFQICDNKALLVADMNSVEDLEIIDSNWTTQEWMRFIRQIPVGKSPNKMAQLDIAFNLSKRGNSEIMAEWYVKSIKNGYEGINAPMKTFLINVGRRKFLEPIYVELSKTPKNLTLAKEIYKEARPNYHSVSFNTIDEILDWSE